MTFINSLFDKCQIEFSLIGLDLFKIKQIMKKLNIISTITLLLTFSINGICQWQNKGFTHLGNARQYRVYKSPNYNASNPASVVFTFHGLGDNMTNFSGIGMNVIADTANIIVVVPQALSDPFAGAAWNAGVGYSGYYPNVAINDVSFISALIDTINANYAINPNRVYACGFSMGGFMTQRLAIELNDKITAFASVSGTLGFGLSSYEPDNKVSIAHFHGTADGTVPFTGNVSGISADSLINFWVDNDLCSSTPIHTSLPDSQNDGYTVDHYLYEGGENGTEVEFFKITGADHVWLTAANDISYTVEIWKFFNKHTILTPSNSIQESLLDDNVSIYPNPAKDNIHIKLSENNIDDQYFVSLYDVSGKQLFTNQIQFQESKSTLSLHNLNVKSGMYLIEVHIPNQGSISRRIIIE